LLSHWSFIQNKVNGNAAIDGSGEQKPKKVKEALDCCIEKVKKH